MRHLEFVPITFTLALGALLLGSPSADAQAAPPTKGPPHGAEQTVGESLDEAILSTKIRMALLKSLKGADGMRIEVTVKDTHAMLAGEVDDRASMKLAGEVTKSVEGVKTVKSDITLNPKSPKQDSFGAQINDATLVTEVRLALLQSIGADAFAIHVAAAGGVVSLRGVLSSRKVRDRVITVVNELSSVKRVEDLIEIAD